MRISSLLGSVSLLCCAVAAQPAFAAEAGDDTAQQGGDTLQEIVVTAERRESTAQKTAASISVRSGEEMLAQGRYSLKSILEDVPGISGGAADNSRSSFGSGTDNPSAGLVIRGITSNFGSAGSTVSNAASAAFYTDEIYNGIGSQYDIDRVEALRGPQGTLYGRSANSGLVSLHTRNPRLDRMGLEASVEGGNYDLVHVTGAVNVPIIEDQLAIRASGNYYQRDGFDADNNGGRHKTTEGRVKLLYKPSDSFSALLGFAFNDTKTLSNGVSITQAKIIPDPLPSPVPLPPGAAAPTIEFPTPDKFVFKSVPATPGHNKAYQVWGQFDLDLGGAKLTWIPAYRTFESQAIVTIRGFLNQDQTIRTPHDRFHTEELRLTSQGDSALQWVVGAMYYNNVLRGDFSEVQNLAAPAQGPIPATPAYLGFRSETDKKTSAFGVFGQATYSLTDVTRLTAGIRYDHTKVAVNQTYTYQDPITQIFDTQTLSGAAGRRKFNNTTFKLRLEQDLSPQNMLYASVSSGFTPGDVSLTADSVPGSFPARKAIRLVQFTSETLTSYELGSKNRFLDDRLQINGAIYYYHYGAYQVANINTAPAGALDPTFRRIAVPLNVWGAEMEVQARPWDGGQLSLNLDYSRGKYHDIPTADAQYFGFHKVPGVAPFRVNASYNHTVDISAETKLLLTGTVHYSSAYNVSQVATSSLTPAGGYASGPAASPYAAQLLAAYPNGFRPLVHLGAKATADLNATLVLSGGKFSITGYARNVTKERFKISSPILTLPGLPTSAPDLNDPRTYGVVLTARF